jgi:hypothetical protein
MSQPPQIDVHGNTMPGSVPTVFVPERLVARVVGLPAGVIQGQHQSLWDENCELRRTLRAVKAELAQTRQELADIRQVLEAEREQFNRLVAQHETFMARLSGEIKRS